MAAPVIQFKRGLLTNLPGLRAGEPGFTTDSYDLYVGFDSTTANNQFVGSGRYWSVNSTTVGSGVKLVEGTDNGTNSITLKSPDSLSGVTTFVMPATGSQDQFLKITSVSGNVHTLGYAAVPSGSFTLAADSGSNDTFTTGETLTFAGGEGVDTTVSDNQITIAAEVATATNAGIASFPASTFYFTGSSGQVGVVTATDTVQGIASFDETDFVVTSGDVAINDEHIEDIVGGMVVGNTETLITVTYQDGDGTLDFEVDNDLANYDNTTSAFITASSSDTLTNKSFDANGTGNSISNIEVADFAAAAIVIESEGIGSNDNDTTIPTSAAVKDYVDNNSPAGTIDISGDTGTASVSTGSTFTFTGTDPVVIAASGAGVTFSVNDASTSSKGIASFDSNDFGVSSGAVSLNDAVVKSVSTDSGAATPSGHAFTVAGTTNEIETSGTSATVTIGLPNDVTISNNLTVTGNLYVNGSTTQVNTSTTTIEDQLLDLGMVDGAVPSSDLNKDIGVLLNYYSGSAKKAAVYWDDSTSRVVVSQDVSESSGVLTNNTGGALEVASLYISGCSGINEVIGCDSGTVVITNATIDGGSF